MCGGYTGEYDTVKIDYTKMNTPRVNMAYCDYIAHTIIKPGLESDSEKTHGLISYVENVKMDLHKTGWMQSTRKTILCKDVNGKEYRIIIEEV